MKEKGLILRGTNFGTLSCAVGALGFYGEGYPFHKWWKLLFYVFGYKWKGYTFAGKTMTLKRRDSSKIGVNGNMPLEDDGVTPKERFPKSIWVEPMYRTTIFEHFPLLNKVPLLRNIGIKPGGHMQNCVGLANFGIEFYLKLNKFQKIKDPYFISIMQFNPGDIEAMCNLIKTHLGVSKNSKFAVQINFACPNTGHVVGEELQDIIEQLTTARRVLGEHIAIIPNFNALISNETLRAIDHLVDAYWIGNTIPAGADVISPEVWKERFNVRFEDGKWESPLTDNGMPMAGGLSGPLCFPITLKKVEEMFMDEKITKPIIAGNGVRTYEDVCRLRRAGADMVFAGSAGVTKPTVLQKLTGQ